MPRVIIFVLLCTFGIIAGCHKNPSTGGLPNPVIDTIIPAYASNGDEITIKVGPLNPKNDQNSLYIGDNALDFSINEEGDMKAILPEDTFNDNTLSVLVYIKNSPGNSQASRVLFCSQYPRISGYSASAVSAGDVVSIFGEYLNGSSASTKILFMGSSEPNLISAQIVSASNEKIEVIVPENAKSGNLFYYTVVKNNTAEVPVGVSCPYLAVK